MATVTGFTAERMQEIEDAAIIDGNVVGDDLILVRHDLTEINAGNVRGPQGIIGPTGEVEEALENGTPYVRKNAAWVAGTETPLRDTLATLTSTNPVVAVGRLVLATDSVPRVFAIGDGATMWSALSKHYSRADPQIATTDTVNAALTGAVIVDRSGLSVTFTVGDIPWIITANEQAVSSSTTGGNPYLMLRDAANVLKKASFGLPMTSIASGGSYLGVVPQLIEIITVPGTYTRKQSVMNAGSGTVNFGLAGSPGVYPGTLIARPI